MNCFQHIPESRSALHNPCGGAPQQRRPLTPQHTPIGFTPTLAHPSALHTRACPQLPPLSILTAARATLARPLHPADLFLCHLGLYQFEFKLVDVPYLLTTQLQGAPHLKYPFETILCAVRYGE